jgi:hypothetical protein
MTSLVVIHRIGFVAGGVAIAIAMFLIGFWTGEARGEGSRPDPASHAVPAWFGPVWDYYDRNPAVTPRFDFAALYAGEMPAAAPARR